jgi:hypothetical protein
MGFMDRLRRLFSGAPTASKDVGLYYYVKCARCGEVIRVRINPMNDLSQSDQGSGFFARKTIVGQRCFNRIDADFTFSGGDSRKLSDASISGGTLVDKAAFDADQAAHPPKS